MYFLHRNSDLILISLIICLSCPWVEAKYGGGTGEPNDPYLIYTAEQLNTIGTEFDDWDRHFKLMADIDLSIYSADEFNIIRYFAGVFDGNNHTISNFTYKPTRMSFANGLFGQVGARELQAGAIIKDLGLIDPNIDSGTGGMTGSLAGLFEGGTITGCYVHGGSVSGDDDVGGLVGGAYFVMHEFFPYRGYSTTADYQQPEISNCYTTCDVSGNEGVGGLLGGANSMIRKISGCHSTASVSGDKYVGGLAGRFDGELSTCFSTANVIGNENVGGLLGENRYGKIYGCFSTGGVLGDRCIGGLVGYIEFSITQCSFSMVEVMGNEIVGGLVGRHSGIISDCYSTGYVSGTIDVGGLLGTTTSTSSSHIYTSYWDIETSGQSESAGGTGKTTIEMKQKATFTDWDFVEVWDIAENQTYPFLRMHTDE
jgi:hypothetical protein